MKRILSLFLVLACVTGLLPPVRAEEAPLEREKSRLGQAPYSYTVPEDYAWKLVAPPLDDRLTLSEDGETATLFAPYVNYDGGWYDTNKAWDGHDTALCWAAASSNLLAWYLDSAERAGADLTGLTRGNWNIFEQFRGIWEPHEGFDMNNGLSWYFSGLFTNSPDDPGFNPPVMDGTGKHMMITRHPGGFLKHFPHADQSFLPISLDGGEEYRDVRKFTGNYQEKFPFCEVLSGIYGTEGDLATHANFSASILRALKYGAIGLVIKNETSHSSNSHAVTLWGADYDTETGKIKHLYLTDSDDFQSGLRTITIQARQPDADGIRMTDYFFGDGGKWSRISDTQMLFAYGAVRDKHAPEPKPPADWEIRLERTEGGTITADRSSAREGERVNLTAQALPGWRWVGWQTTPALTIEDNSFLMPGEDVRVSAVFERLPVVLTGLTITKAPDKTVYTEGEIFDPAGLVVQAEYSDGSGKTVQPEFSREPLTLGQTAVVLTYTEGKTTVEAVQPIMVEEKKPLWPQITDNPDGSRTVADLLEDGTLVKTTAFPGKPAHWVEVRLSEQALEGQSVTVLPISPVNVENCPVIRVENRPEQVLTVKIPVEHPTEGTTAVELSHGAPKVLRRSVVVQDGVVCTVESGAEVRLEDRARRFADVKSGHWFRPAVDFVSGRGLFAGVNDTDFGPGLHMTRGMLAQVLHTLHDHPTAHTRREFPDVTAQNWYFEAVDWAAEQNIISGYPDGRFGGEDPITREQLALMLYSAAGKPAVSPEQLDFVDGDKVSGYAETAVRWAVEHRIMAGDNRKQLNPQGLASRAEVAAMLRGFVNDFYG